MVVADTHRRLGGTEDSLHTVDTTGSGTGIYGLEYPSHVITNVRNTFTLTHYGRRSYH